MFPACAASVAEQIAYVRGHGAVANGPKRVLVIGASTGYGLASRITAAVSRVAGVTAVHVAMGVMSPEQRTELRSMLRGGSPEPVIPFAQPHSLTKVFAVASGKGGVGVEHPDP